LDVHATHFMQGPRPCPAILARGDRFLVSSGRK
jgi:hypothetical protein